MELEKKVELYATIDQMVFGVMQQNQIPASVMTDALNHTLLQLKDSVIQELILEQRQSKQDTTEGVKEDGNEE